jgi:hypothetical protein
VEGHLVGGVVASLTLLTLALGFKYRWRSANAFRWLLAAGAGMAGFALNLLAGLHHCDQGTPIRLAALFGGLTFVSFCFMSPMRLRLLWSVALLFVGIVLCYHVANLYHRELFTGNPKLSSGRYWHSFFTEIYGRRTIFALGTGGKSMNSNRVIFSAEEAEKIGYYRGGTPPFWTPTDDQVQELELLLPKYLNSHPPIDDKPVGNFFEYGRQYFGVTQNNRRLIYLITRRAEFHGLCPWVNVKAAIWYV